MTEPARDLPAGRIPPVFIGGAGRSGTTLVVDMLGLHPQLSPVYETDFLLMVARTILAQQDPERSAPIIRKMMDDWTGPLPHRPHNKRGHERYFHGPHHILFDRQFALAQTETLIAGLQAAPIDAFRRFVDALFAEHCRLDGKDRWINKTPVYVSNLPLLLSLFPDLKFIHCVRDGRDVGCSVITRPWGPATFVETAPWWCEIVQRGIDFGQEHPDRCIEVRYEDLITAPARVLPDILRRLEVENGADAILAHYGDRDGDLSLNEAALHRWRREVPADEVKRFEDIAGDTLLRFGYALS